MTVFTSDGRESPPARLVGVEVSTDLALLDTDHKSVACLRVDAQPARVGDACAVIFEGPTASVIAVNGRLLSRREALDWSETSFLELWSVGLKPGLNGITGAPVITRSGGLAGMCDFTNSQSRQEFLFAIPEKAIADFLARTRSDTAPKSLLFPSPGEISKRTGQTGEKEGEYIEGMRMMDHREFALAAEKFRAVLKRHPNDPLVLGQLLRCLSMSGQMKELSVLQKEAHNMGVVRLMTQLAQAEALSMRGLLDASIQKLESILARAPKLGRAWGILGLALSKAGRHQEAQDALQKWTELEPESLDAWNEYSGCLRALGQPEAARAATARAEELDSLQFKLRTSEPLEIRARIR